jgi:hypothetical protein
MPEDKCLCRIFPSARWGTGFSAIILETEAGDPCLAQGDLGNANGEYFLIGPRDQNSRRARRDCNGLIFAPNDWVGVCRRSSARGEENRAPPPACALDIGAAVRSSLKGKGAVIESTTVPSASLEHDAYWCFRFVIPAKLVLAEAGSGNPAFSKYWTPC